MSDKIFFDTNLWVYLALNSKNKDDIRKKHQMEALIVVSNQVLNELANVLIKKYTFKIEKVKSLVHKILNIVELCTLTVEDSLLALDLTDQYGFSYYDSLIVSSALSYGCTSLYTEDMHHNTIVKDQLKIVHVLEG